MRDHNSRRRKRNYHSRMANLAYAMVSGDTKSVISHYEDMVRYGGKMDRRDCEEFMREFHAEMENQVPSKRERVVRKEKRKIKSS
mgnify:CR=1 FL=1